MPNLAPSMPADAARSPVLAEPAPELVEVNGMTAVRAPRTPAETGLDEGLLKDLLLKVAFAVPQFATEWAAQRLHLPQAIVAELLEQLRVERLVEVLGQTGPLGYRFTIAQRGRERGARLLEI